MGILTLAAASARPLGFFLAGVAEGADWLSLRPIKTIENRFYRLAGVDPGKEQSWLAYTLAMLMFSFAGVVLLYAMQRLQALLPAVLNPEGFGAVPADLAFNTAISFVTNTNWQAYGGETAMSHFVQMAGLTVQNLYRRAKELALRHCSRAEAARRPILLSEEWPAGRLPKFRSLWTETLAQGYQ